MIDFRDINDWLVGVKPEGFYLHSVDPRGVFLVVQYRRTILWPNTLLVKGYDTCDIYLNSDGRPVGKLFDRIEIPIPPAILRVPVGGGKKFWFGVRLALRGLREIFHAKIIEQGS